MKTLLLILTAISFSMSTAFARNDNKKAEKEHEEHHDEHGHDEKEKILKLNPKAQEHLKIEFSKVSGKSPWKVPRSALVQVKDHSGLYKMHGETLEFIEINVTKTDKDSITFTTEHLHDGDSVAVKGTQFIRIMESELNSEPAGHGH
jgi:hypothetical protein